MVGEASTLPCLGIDVEFGAHLPLISFAGEQRSLGDLIAFAEAARDLGYTHLCANDHLVFPRPWLDGPTALAAVLPWSGQMTLATTVAVPVLRGPAATAKILAAIDVLSGGRLMVGLGPGSSARDYQLVGVPFEERWKRLEDAVQALRAYWRGDDVAFEGAFYSTGGFTLAPTPAQRPGPPIWIGSWGSPAGLRRVARLADGWLASGYNTSPDLFAQAWADVQEQVAALGRDSSSFPNAIATMWCYVTEDGARADAVLADVLAPMLDRPVEQLRAILPIGSAEECAAKLRAYEPAGAQRVFLWPLADECAQLQVFRDRVIPLLDGDRA
jgi:probable F420-dependent oxidoreductase